MKPIRNILVARDFSPCSERALEVALTLADRADATLHVVHADVLHADPYGQPEEPAGSVDKLRERLKEDVERDRDESARFDPGSVKIEHAVVRDVAAAPALIRYAEEHDIDFIVMGTHGRTGLRRMLIGSVAEEVVRWVPCPVLTMRADSDVGDEVHAILVPVDFSESSKAAVRQAVRLGRLYGARIDLLHVGETVPVPSFYDTGFLVYEYGPKFTDHTIEQLHGLADDAMAAEPGERLEVRAHVGVGQVPGVIVKEAERLGSDVVVMGTRGLSGLKHLLLGSVAERVLRTAPCPVVVAKSEADIEHNEALAAEREPRPTPATDAGA
jgi:nucleotide-binding universal stress UspA family protein